MASYQSWTCKSLRTHNLQSDDVNALTSCTDVQEFADHAAALAALDLGCFYRLTGDAGGQVRVLRITSPAISAFEAQIDTEGAGGGVTLLTMAQATWCGDMDWGDCGPCTTYNSLTTPTHDYGVEGVYTIMFCGTISGFSYPGGGTPTQLSSITTFGPSFILGTGAFTGCTNLTAVSATDTPDLSAPNNLGSCFNGCSSFNSDISSWDTTNTTSTNAMFLNCTVYNQPMVGMFGSGSVLSCTTMFQGCVAFSQDISSWDMSGVTTSSEMFKNCSAYNNGGLSIGGMDWSSCTSMSNMFELCTSFVGTGVGTWLTPLVSNFSRWCTGCTSFNADMTGFDTSGATNMLAMFATCSSFVGTGVAGFDTSSVTNMQGVFQFCSVFNGDVSSWDTSSATTMVDMFRANSLFDQDISGFDLSNVTTTNSMLRDCLAFDNGGAALTGLDCSSCTVFTSMFFNCEAFNQDVSNWVFSVDITSTVNMFSRCDVFVGTGLDTWTTTAFAGSCQAMFQLCPDFNGDVSSWDMSRVTNCTAMFANGSSFSQDLSGWDLTACSRYEFMFQLQTGFNGDVGWMLRTVSIHSLGNMFNIASSFTGIGLDAWDIDALISSSTFAVGAAISTANYDALLIAWDAQSIVFAPAISLNFGSVQYTGSISGAARANLIANGLTPSDGGDNGG